MFVLSGCGKDGTARKPPSCWHGGRSTRPWWDESGGVRHVSAWFVDASSVALRSDWSWHVSTTLGQARFPINAGGVGCVWLGMVGPGVLWRIALRCHVSGPVELWLVQAGFGTKLVQARCWINASGLGLNVVWRAMAMSVVAMQGAVRQGLSRLRTAIAVGAVRLRRLVAGCTMEWCGGLSLGLSRFGEAWIFRQGGVCGR